MISTAEIVRRLKSKATRRNLEGMARFGISIEKRLGVSVPEMRRIAKETGQDHTLAIKLWKTRIAECRIVASMIADPEKLTGIEMDRWAGDFNSWDVCDQVCMNLFAKTPMARKKITDWSKRDEEFVKRAAYALIACLAWHDEDAPNAEFTKYLSIIKGGATDGRNFVKKSLNWALRNIGKRNVQLNRAALKTAGQIQRLDSKAARWIAADAARELKSAAVQKRLRRQQALGSGDR